ncbi:MAG: 50S ribosomal protein L30 [Candidatus Melainabacteria bacterium]|nr:50S ribosomal protein L30 [Candidatus Melainabacteria bacterium]
MLKITLTAGKIGKKERQLKVLEALGLRKFGSSVVRRSSPTIKGMLDKVGHLVEIVEVADTTPTGKVTRREQRESRAAEIAAGSKAKTKAGAAK